MQRYEITIIEKRMLSTTVEANNEEEAKKLFLDDRINMSDFKEVDGSQETYHYETCKFDEPNWQDVLIKKAYDFGFIEISQGAEAIKIIDKYNNEDELFEALNNSEDKLSQAIANATQI
ncbi:hypothetical protein [Aliarcobacter lanthieri]|uniref:hypothetical protein n=1 Tax=Aliarcobacter lanthieri TaxID=1355374 RepID=UPI00047CBB8C|nr:hypothetical protein [Aliarcobacter lanthieri]QKF59228.1 hypothetical protein ALANTH_1119 [Aliarcobacter lanthieri]